MKKTFVYIIIFFLLIAVLKYRFSNYNIDYKVNNYQVKTIYKNNRFYYEINDGTKSYNFDVYKSRTFMKTKIDKIESISDETITIYLENSRAPGIIRDEEGKYVYLVLPVNFNSMM